LHAFGLSQERIAQALDVSKSYVQTILRRPDVGELATSYRQAIIVQQMAHVVSLNDKAWTAADAALSAGDTRGFDAVTRGLAAMEKIAASASGENRPKPLVAVQNNVSVEAIDDELRQLLGILGVVPKDGVIEVP
jgi:hypothetical protein